MRGSFRRLIVCIVALSCVPVSCISVAPVAAAGISVSTSIIDLNTPITVELVGFTGFDIVSVTWSCKYLDSTCRYDCYQTWTAYSRGLTTGEITFESAGRYEIIATVAYVDPNGWGGPETRLTEYSRVVNVFPLTIIGMICGLGLVALIIIYIIYSRRKNRGVRKPRSATGWEREEILAKAQGRREVLKPPEEKQKARQREAQTIEALSVVQLAPVPVVKIAAAKRVVTSSARGGTAIAASPMKTIKPVASSGTRPKDKSGYSQNDTDTNTQVNRTVLKEYIERQRKEGARELHYLKIKNDLNVISKKKSSKLYRILQDLVDDEILVRKGSNYIIVG